MTITEALFLKLIEEANEIAHISCKILAFGLESHKPSDETKTTNHELLISEIFDLIGVLSILTDSDVLKLKDKDFQKEVLLREERIKKFIEIRKQNGNIKE